MALVGGTITFRLNGQTYKAKGNFTYNIGSPIRERIVNRDGSVDYKETPQAPSIKGEITDDLNLDLRALTTTANATATLDLGVGKGFVLGKAVYSGTGDVETDEGNIAAEFFGETGEEV